jgi:pimeloyl-ACP methyl ester carboxylesterase
MIRFNILNRSKPRTVLLIHGLFTSSGYWLPYLASLKECRLLILDIDYSAIGDIEPYLRRVGEIIDAEAGGQVDAVIAHSLGALIASRLPGHVRQSSFEVCPVYCATRLNSDEFVGDIESKLKFAMSGEQIRSLLAEVDGAIVRHRAGAPAPRAAIYLPDADPYFAYHAAAASQQFHGDHFDIAEAVADIGRELAA